MSTSADIMLQLRLLLHAISRKPTGNHASVSSPIPTRIPIAPASLIPNPKPTSIHICIPSIALTLAPSGNLMPAPLPLSPTHTHHGIRPHLFRLAGSCHRLHHHKKPTFINGLLHVAL